MNDELDEDIPGLEDGTVAELLEAEDEDADPDPDPDDEDELLPRDNAATEDVTLLDKELIIEGALTPDGGLIDVKELEEFEIKALVEEFAELAGNVGIELPLPTREGALADEPIDWDEELEPEKPVLWVVTTLVEEELEPVGPVLWVVITLVEEVLEPVGPVLWVGTALVEEELEPVGPVLWLVTTLVEKELDPVGPVLWLVTTLVEEELEPVGPVLWLVTTLVEKELEPVGPVLWLVTKLVEEDSEPEGLVFWPVTTLVEEDRPLLGRMDEEGANEASRSFGLAWKYPGHVSTRYCQLCCSLSEWEMY